MAATAVLRRASGDPLAELEREVFGTPPQTFFPGIPPRVEPVVDLILAEPKLTRKLRRHLFDLDKAFKERMR